MSSEIDRVAGNTQFNGLNLLDGTFKNQKFQVGANANQTIAIADIGNARTSALGQQYTASAQSAALDGTADVDLSTLKINGEAIGTGTVKADAKTLVNAINSSNIAGVTAKIDAATTAAKAGQTAIAGAGTITINGITTSSISATGNATSDRALAVEAINAISAATGVTAKDEGDGVSLTAADGRNIALSYTQTAGTFGAANFGMSGANTYETTYTVSYAGESGGELDITAATNSGLTTAKNSVQLSGTAISNLSVETQEKATEALGSIDAALKQINSSRASLGAIQNRFSSTIANLQTTSENLSASRGRIVDADFATETANLTRSQILQQAGTAMLAQANGLPQNVLSLLRG